MNVAEAANIVRRALKSNYGDETVLPAISLALNELIRYTEVSRTNGEVTVAEGAQYVDIASTLTDFRSERLLHARIGYRPMMQRVSFRAIVTALSYNQSGIPNTIAFEDGNYSRAFLYPTADDDYTMTVAYKAPLVELTGNRTLNIPDEYLHGALWFGAAAAVEHNDPNAMYQSVAWRRFMDEIIPSVRSGMADKGVLQVTPNDAFE